MPHLSFNYGISFLKKLEISFMVEIRIRLDSPQYFFCDPTNTYMIYRRRSEKKIMW